MERNTVKIIDLRCTYKYSTVDFEGLTQLSVIDLNGLDGNEQNIKYNIVIKFLSCFGYDKFDLEHAAQGSRLDINIGNKIIVETKALNKNLDAYISQVQQYCSNERPYLAVLTNGKTFRFYSPFMRVPVFAETLIYEFNLTDLSNKELVERIDKIIGLEYYTNNTYITYIQERENELVEVRGFIDGFDKVKHENVQTIMAEIQQMENDIIRLEGSKRLKEQEIEQIQKKREPEKEELFKKHFVPTIGQPNAHPIITPTPIITDRLPLDGDKIYLIDRPGDGVKARGKFYNTKRFTVFKGSTVSVELDDTFGKGAADGAFRLRKDLESSGIINKSREFTEDYVFNTVSQAACVILGGSRSGPREWGINLQ